ncbi:MAG: divergent polysaccharide deacetylase family protein [Alphaproteobacteria bacterium]|nr:divergent polysaccharide deacetylase family protein [Alphaproteobacteria bacterium]
MKKARRRKLQLVFWLCVATAGLWVAFAPPLPVRVVPSARVKVELPPLAEEPLPKEPEIERPGQMLIAVVIDDLGLDIRDTRRAINLPPQVTLAFLPYATRLKEQARDARNHGHELLLHMPMEPMGRADPGPGALLTGLPQDELQRRLEVGLASFTGFDGVNNHMGSKFTADAAGMDLVMKELQQRSLFFLDSRTSTQSVGEQTARQYGLATIGRDVFLDDDGTLPAIRKQIEQAEHIARRKGHAVVIGHPHPTTLEALESWLPDAEARGFRFVPVRELAKP